MTIYDSALDSGMDYKVKQLSLAVTNYFDQNPDLCKVPAKDLMPSLVESGLFAKDQKQGLPIRNLLREIDRKGEIKKFPFIVADKMMPDQLRNLHQCLTSSDQGDRPNFPFYRTARRH